MIISIQCIVFIGFVGRVRHVLCVETFLLALL